jgi:hypothetical protein
MDVYVGREVALGDADREVHALADTVAMVFENMRNTTRAAAYGQEAHQVKPGCATALAGARNSSSEGRGRCFPAGQLHRREAARLG